MLKIKNGRNGFRNYDLEWSGSCNVIGWVCLLLQVNISTIKIGIQCRRIDKLIKIDKNFYSLIQVKCSDKDKKWLIALDINSILDLPKKL